MSLFNFRLYDTQARWSLMLAVVTFFGCAATGFMVFQHFSMEYNSIFFNPNSKRHVTILGTGAMIIMIGITSWGLGFNSLGEKRNTQQTASWMGILMSSLFTALTALCLFAWIQLKKEQTF